VAPAASNGRTEKRVPLRLSGKIPFREHCLGHCSMLEQTENIELIAASASMLVEKDDGVVPDSDAAAALGLG